MPRPLTPVVLGTSKEGEPASTAKSNSGRPIGPPAPQIGCGECFEQLGSPRLGLGIGARDPDVATQPARSTLRSRSGALGARSDVPSLTSLSTPARPPSTYPARRG